MVRASAILALIFCVALGAAAQGKPDGSPRGASTSNDPAASSAGKAAPQESIVDGIAAHIGNDVVTESEVRQLADYQKLLEGQAQSRATILQELVNQWIVRSEAAAIKFPRPSSADVNREFQALLSHFPSRQDFQTRLAAVNLTQGELLQVLESQIYYVRFLDYKFHAATQVTKSQIEAYYEQKLAPQLQKKGTAVPPLSKVTAQIRQVLTQEQINKKASQWLAETKARLRIVIQPSGGAG